MNRAVMFLLPCLPVVRRLEVRKRWWHRLCVVVFFKLLLSTLLAVAAISYLTWAPKVRDYPMVWENFYLFDVSGDGLPKIEGQEGHVVQMPNGTWATFPYGTSDEEIHALWTQAKRQSRREAGALGGSSFRLCDPSRQLRVAGCIQGAALRDIRQQVSEGV
jgi:hypothetical protein